MEAPMAAKKTTKKAKTVAKKATETVLKNTRPSASALDFSSFGKAFTEFKPLNLETNMFKGNKQMEKMAQDATVMGQDQMEAVVKASTIFAKGMEDIMKTCMEIAQSAGEKNQTMAKTIMSCKTLNEFTDVQTRIAQSSFDEFMTNATKISEKTVKLMTEAMEPINDQMGKSIKRASDSMAA
jgi:phasin family protein